MPPYDAEEPSEIRLPSGERAILRPASVADAPKMVALDRALAEDGRGMVITPDQVRTVDEEARRIDSMYRDWSADRATLFLVAELEGEADRAVGSGQLNQLTPARCEHVGILSVGVHPDYQRRGIGRAIIERLVEHARSCGLERLELYTMADNARAIALYQSLGFEHEGTRVRFVRREDGSYMDDLVMARFL